MARQDFKQRVVFELDDQASPKVDNVQSSFSKLGSFLSSKFAITLGDVVDAFKSITGAVGDVINAAQVQEQAVQSLDQALAGLGPRAGEVSKALQDQAAALEATTEFSDEAIIKNQALALNLGVSADQAGKLTAAAVELSAATGRSLESSFVNLARTLNGFRGELGELVPEVASMGVEALKSGAALDVVLDRLGGTAQARVDTFSGRLTQLGNAWGTVTEKLGEAITENEAIQTAFEKLQRLITSQQFLGGIEAVATGFSRITTVFVDAITYTTLLASGLTEIGKRLKEFTERVLEAIGPLRTYVETLSTFLYEYVTFVPGLLKKAADAVIEYGQASDGAAESTDKLNQSTAQIKPTISSYTAGTNTLTEAVTARTDAEDRASSVTNAFKNETDQATESLLTFEEANRQVEAQANSLTRSLEETARAAAQVQSATGGQLTARDRRSQADVDAALAAGMSPTMGGTRIRTADGSGSRLLR